jgi:DinB family protein
MSLAQALAAGFEDATNELIGFLEQVPETDWRSLCPDEGWPIGVTAHHVAVAFPAHMRVLQAIADGGPASPIGWSDLDRINAEHARRHAECGKRETIELLTARAEAAADALRNLSDEQLEHSGRLIGDLPELTVSQWVELVLIGHVRMHHGSIRAAVCAADGSRAEKAV